MRNIILHNQDELVKFCNNYTGLSAQPSDLVEFMGLYLYPELETSNLKAEHQNLVSAKASGRLEAAELNEYAEALLKAIYPSTMFPLGVVILDNPFDAQELTYFSIVMLESVDNITQEAI